MNVRKLLAILISSCVLGMQLWIIMPPFHKDKTWYWPFLNYPMYSPSRQANATIEYRELRASPCTPGSDAFTVSARMLGMRKFTLYAMLKKIATSDASPASQSAADSSMALLSHLLRTRLPSPVCSVRIHTTSITLGQNTPQEHELSLAVVGEGDAKGPSSVADSMSRSLPTP